MCSARFKEFTGRQRGKIMDNKKIDISSLFERGRVVVDGKEIGIITAVKVGHDRSTEVTAELLLVPENKTNSLHEYILSKLGID